MSWIVTADGDELLLRNPRPGHLTINSIANSLAQINRFNGHAARPYSVAEHSLLVCTIAEREYGVTDAAGRLAALMHDAHEAWCGDMHSPGKVEIGPAWYAWEDHLMQHTHRAFALSGAMLSFSKAIKLADLTALATERRDLLPARATTPWACLEGIEPVGWVYLNSQHRASMSWTHWRDKFLTNYDVLDFARNHHAGLSVPTPETGAQP